jgi:hypothetical protein
VAKKTAGEFFAAVDDVLTGAVPARDDTGTASAVDGTGPTGAGKPTSAGGRTFVAPARATPGPPGGLLTGALVGAAIALAGVLVGRLLGRRG